jgi:lysozyme family protein
MAGVTDDGQIGPVTIRAVNSFISAHGVAEAVRRYQGARRDYYRALSTFNTFGRGWLRRVDEVETAALRLVQ